MKIDLEQRAEKPNTSWSVPWKKSRPFLQNPRAYLTHRIRYAHTYVIHGAASHDTVDYWCGNFGRGEFVDAPPEGRLLCVACEAQAVAHGQPTAEELTGRHVCLGKLRAVRTCCQNDEN